MPISDGLMTADHCTTGTPGSLGNSSVFPNIQPESHLSLLLLLEAQHGAGKMLMCFLLKKKRGRVGPHWRYTDASNESRKDIVRNNFILYLPICTSFVLSLEYGEIAKRTEPQACINTVSIERFCSSALVMTEIST